jgi:uncharacterized repeat protein (TIGR03803 family)
MAPRIEGSGSRLFIRLVCAAAALAVFESAEPQSYSVPKLNTVYNFVPADYPHIGNFELSTLVQASDGNLYGVSAYGGVNDLGYVYQVSPTTGLLVHLHDFGFSDGATPRGKLLQASDGDLYGTTESGGANQSDYCYAGKGYNESGCGTLFKISLQGSFTKLHDFYTSHDGYQSSPSTGVVQGGDGNFYGMAMQPFPSGTTSLFKMTPAGAVSVLHEFATDLSEGYLAYAGLLLAQDGQLYGTTSGNGAIPGSPAGGCGTVFQATLRGQLAVLHTFSGSGTGGVGDGCLPWSTLVERRGAFYGTTTYGGNQLNNCAAVGCGIVYKITASGTEIVLHRFQATPKDGEYPQGDGLAVASDGTLYGTTGGNAYGEDITPLCYLNDGATSSCGTIYQIDTGDKLTQLAIFGGGNGSYGLFPHATLILASDDNFYANTFAGGGWGFGSVFRLVLNANTPIVAIDSFTPLGGPPGTSVVLTGTGFTGATEVTVGSSTGLLATSFSVISDSEISALIPQGAQSSAFGVSVPEGTTYSPVDFYLQPVITSITPTSGTVGSGVTLQGRHFDDLTSITIGGVAATNYSYVTNQDTAINVIVPRSANSGPIVVTNPGGSAWSQYFTVVPGGLAAADSISASGGHFGQACANPPSDEDPAQPAKGAPNCLLMK